MRCEIVVPVGPGHEDIYKRAVESVRMASMDKGPFKEIGMRLIDDSNGELGRSKARNQGVEEADADYLFFLDADDVLHPSCFANFSSYAGYDACWGAIVELRNGVAGWRYQVPKLFTYEQLLAFDPYQTLQMGHFVRTEVAQKHPFNEELDTGEDWDYYLRVWKDHKCIKIDQPFFLNDRTRHSTGPKAATGRDWMDVVYPMMQEARNAHDRAA